MRMQFRILFALIFLCKSFFVAAQENGDSTKNADSFQPGYIVLKDRTDTLRGDISFVTKKMGYMEKVKFKKTGSEKITKYDAPWKSELRYFGTAEKRCRYVNWVDDSISVRFYKSRPAISDWVTMIEDGAIKLSVGFIVGFESNNKNAVGMIMIGANGTPQYIAGGGGRAIKVYTPIYCLKKGDRPLALIPSEFSSQSIKEEPLSYKLDERTRKYFLTLIQDDPELLAKSNYKDFYMYHVLKIVQEYNERHKMK